MGQTAENAAQLYGIGRAALDRFALASLQKVVAAQQEGRSSRS
jgi:acetyl-CoA acetyltransferase